MTLLDATSLTWLYKITKQYTDHLLQIIYDELIKAKSVVHQLIEKDTNLMT